MKEFVTEKWSAKYKRSIDCSHPKGFSQRAHCAGRKKNEGVAEDYDQTAADNALLTAMTTIAARIKTRIAAIVDYKKAGKNWSNFANNINSDVHDPLYNNYLRQAFNTTDTKINLTDEQVNEILKKYPGGPFQNLNIVDDNAGGWRHFYRKDRSEFETGNNSKKFYQTLNPSITAEQLDKVLVDLTKYLQDSESEATGFFGFKVPTSGYGTESDTLVCYFSGDPRFNMQNMATGVIKQIVNNAQRVKHRAEWGSDTKNYKYKHSNKVSSSESDSSMLVKKFAEYLIDKAEILNDYFTKTPNDVPKILAKTWKEKFEGKDWQTVTEQGRKKEEDQHPNEKPLGPETKPTMPKGTIRVDVSDVYDWYKLGQRISDLRNAEKAEFGKGPPATILSFGSEDEEHEYIQALKKLGLDITDIDPKYHDAKKSVKTDPTYNVDENFADGKNPGRKGLAKRSGVNCKQSVTQLRKVAKNSSGEKARMAHWCANMKSGKQK